MPREDGVNGQRLRGFGYVEFREREDLIEALKLNNENLNGRSLRISVPGEHDGDRSGGRRTDDGEANLSNDWRAGRGPLPPRDDVRSGRDGPPRNGFGDRDRSGGFRSGGFEDRGNPRDSERRPDAGGFDTFDRTNRDRAFQRRDDDSFQRGRGGGSGGGFDNDRRSDDRGGYGRREGGGFEDRGNSRGFERRDGGGGGGFSNFQRADDRRERTNDYERGPRRDYNDAPRDSDRPRYGNHDDRATSQREEAPGGEPPKERKRLQLQPRSKPVEVETVASTAIFGGAKPVDTAKKEQEIEAKLHAKHDGKPRDEADSPQGGERVRRTSATSNNSGSNRSRKNSENKDDVERREPRRRFDSDRERDRDYRTSNRGGPRDAGRGPPREFNRGSDRDRYPRDNNFRRDGPREYQRGDREGGPRSDRGDRPPRADSKPIGYVEPVSCLECLYVMSNSYDDFKFRSSKINSAPWSQRRMDTRTSSHFNSTNCLCVALHFYICASTIRIICEYEY